MASHRMDTEDLILPVQIIHNSEQIWNGKSLEQNYNYLWYEFETDHHLYRARAYLDDIQTVSIYGPYEKNTDPPVSVQEVEIDRRVLAYLRRRYAKIERLGNTGYVPVE